MCVNEYRNNANQVLCEQCTAPAASDLRTCLSSVSQPGVGCSTNILRVKKKTPQAVNIYNDGPQIKRMMTRTQSIAFINYLFQKLDLQSEQTFCVAERAQLGFEHVWLMRSWRNSHEIRKNISSLAFMKNATDHPRVIVGRMNLLQRTDLVWTWTDKWRENSWSRNMPRTEHLSSGDVAIALSNPRTKLVRSVNCKAGTQTEVSFAQEVVHGRCHT